jgi:hypothetical protein
MTGSLFHSSDRLSRAGSVRCDDQAFIKHFPHGLNPELIQACSSRDCNSAVAFSAPSIALHFFLDIVPWVELSRNRRFDEAPAGSG